MGIKTEKNWMSYFPSSFAWQTVFNGSLTGRILASGTVHLGKHARLEGAIDAAGLKMEAGAECEGLLTVGGRAPAEEPRS